MEVEEHEDAASPAADQSVQPTPELIADGSSASAGSQGNAGEPSAVAEAEAAGTPGGGVGDPSVEAAESESEEEDDEDDPVVREIEVYINRVADDSADSGDGEGLGSMLLLQYPLRPVYRPYGDQGRLLYVKTRKQQRTFQLLYGLNIESDNFDEGKRLEILELQRAAAEAGENSAQVPGSLHILNSIVANPQHSTYGLGLLKDNRMYITPVSDVLQFRPDFSHVDAEVELSRRRADEHLTGTPSTVSKATTSEKSSASSSKEAAEPTDPALAAQPAAKAKAKAAAAPAGGGSAAGAAAALAAASAASAAPQGGAQRLGMKPSKVRDALEAEPWLQIEAFHDPDSSEAHEIVNLLSSFKVKVSSAGSAKNSRGSTALGDDVALSMLPTDEAAKSTENEEEEIVRYQRVGGGRHVPIIRFSEDFDSYVDCICSVKTTEADREAAVSAAANEGTSGPLSYLSLSKLTTEQQVLKVLKHKQVETFSKVKALLTRKVDDSTLLNYFKSYADCVFGNWVCKSHLVYNGLEIHCRDLLICLMALGRTIVREQVKKFLGNLPMDKLTEMISKIGVYRNNAWHFKLPEDLQFKSNHPEVVAEGMKKYNPDTVKGLFLKITQLSQAQTEILNQQAKEAQKKGADGGKGGERPASSALALIDPDRLAQATIECLKVGGVMTPQELLEKIPNYLTSKMTTETPQVQRLITVGLAALKVEDVIIILPRVADELGCNLWAVQQLGNAQVDRYRKALISLFKRQGLDPTNSKPLSKSDLLMEFHSRLKTKFDLPDFTFRKLMREFAVNQGGLWVFKGFARQKQAEDDAAENE